VEPSTLAAITETLAPLAAVRVAYVFGSQLTGRARTDSDLDLAVRFERGLDVAERLDVTLSLIDALTTRLGPLGERTDVVDLERCDPAVAFAAISGTRVLERDRAERIALEARIARTYEDDAPRRELYRRAAQARWGGE
jgi:predicted nucleotidyltransferase